MVCCLCCGERVPGPSPVGQCGSVSTRPLVPLACACPGFWLKRKKKTAPPRSPCRRVEKKHHNTGVETAARALAFAALVPFAVSLDRFQSRPERLLCFVFYPLSLLSCQAVSAGIRYSGVPGGRIRKRGENERFPAARPTYESHLTRSSRRAPHTFQEITFVLPTVNTVGYGKVLHFASFPTFGGSQKRRFALFYVLVFRIPLSKHYLSVRNGSLLQWRICSHVNMK